MTCSCFVHFFTFQGLGDEEFRLVYNGRSLHDDDVPFDGGDVPSYPTLHVHLRVRGGKGGFGSMLRAMGSQRSGHETDNIESCRDLSGRRIRHVNDEKKIAEWMSKQNERDALAVELAERKAEKRQRALTQPKHNYDHHGLLIEQNESADKVDEGVRAGFAASLIHSKRLLDGPIREKKTSKVAFGLVKGPAVSLFSVVMPFLSIYFSPAASFQCCYGD